ncbi:MAG: TIGR02996 domain-containing protein, partial [Deltaproteobacteria bacterium]|nr:TIGR02996 domain-containing protein [Deltaproteobacteria bacterium]
MSDVEACNAELEDAIARDPYDVDLYAVYADWLQQRGHVRGELIAAQLAELRGSAEAVDAREDLLAIHAGALLGPLASDRHLALTWRCGFVHAAAAAAGEDATSRELLRGLATLLAHPSGRLLVRLDVRITHGGPELVELLAAHAPPTLRDLRIATEGELELADLWPRCRRLRGLAISAASSHPGELVLPQLERA